MPQVDTTVQILALIVAAIVMAFGTIAAVLPIVPGPAVVWAATVVYAIVTGFHDIGLIPLIILTILMIVGSTSDFWLGLVGVKAAGGSLWSVLGSIGGMVI